MFLWLLCVPFPLHAAEPAASPPPAERVTVRVDGRSVFRVGPTGSESAPARAATVERRIAALREKPDAIAPVVIAPGGEGGGSRVLSVAGVPVVTVTAEDAQDNLADLDALASQWAAALDRALERSRARRQTGWGRFRAEVQASVEAAFSRLAESAVTVVPRVIAAALVILLFWALAGALRFLMRVVFRRVISDLTLENLIKQVVYYAVWVLGLIVAVDALGWDPQATATGLGLTGLALGFALKDILSNFVSGLLLLASRPFEVGDQIVVGETEGSVVKIMLRATQIRTYDGRVVLVPNAEIFTNRITNNTASPVRRGTVELYLGYDQDVRRAAAVARDAAAGADGVLADPPPSVRIVELGQDDVVLEVRFWTDSRRSDFVATSSAVRAALIEAMKRAGVGLPDPDVRILTVRRGTADGGAPRRARNRGGDEATSGGGT